MGFDLFSVIPKSTISMTFRCCPIPAGVSFLDFFPKSFFSGFIEHVYAIVQYVGYYTLIVSLTVYILFLVEKCKYKYNSDTISVLGYIRVDACKCDCCGHVWLPRGDEEPLRCANCKNAAWNRKRK